MTVMRRGRQDGTPTELSDLLSIVNVMASSYRSTAAASGAETKRRPGNRQHRPVGYNNAALATLLSELVGVRPESHDRRAKLGFRGEGVGTGSEINPNFACGYVEGQELLQDFLGAKRA
jgi:hypothetical protein